MIANFDSLMALKSSVDMGFPFPSFSSSLKVIIPFSSKAAYRWSVKFFRVSSPLKLRKTSFIPRGVEVDDDDDEEEEEKAV